MLTDTKIESWIKLQPELGKKQAEMLTFFQTHPNIKFTRSNLAFNLHWRLSSVCGRVNELVALGKLEVAGTIWDSQTKRTVELLKLKQSACLKHDIKA